jgi:hypothetical protein
MSTESQKRLLLAEAVDIASNTTILGVFYGIVFALYCLCARSLFLELQVPDKRRQTRFTLSYISLIFFCATAFLVLNMRMVQLAYIVHSDFPGGPLNYELSYSSITTSNMAATEIFDLTIEVLTMAIQVIQC